MQTFDFSNGVTERGFNSLLDALNLSSLNAQNEYRAKEGKPPLTHEQQVKLYGRVIA